MKNNLLFFVFIIYSLLISCSEKDVDNIQTPLNEIITINNNVINGPLEGQQLDGADPDDLLETSSFTSIVKIIFGNMVSVDNPLADKGVTVTVNGQDVVINASASSVAYEISGTTADGSLKIYSDKKLKLSLNKTSITNSEGPAINIQSGKRVFVVLNNHNTLEDGSSYATSTEDQKGTFFSEGQLIFSGSGTLNVTGNNKHGIVSDDYIRVLSGHIIVHKASSDAIHANDGIYIDGGTFDIKANSDGIEAEKGEIIINSGEFKINVVDDGIAASWDEDNTIDPYVIINGGNFEITTTEGEGIESKSILTINGGNINITAYDDAINAGKAIYINNGNIVAYSKSNDGIDSNGTLTITGGRIFAIGYKSPEEGFDCDNNTFKITGGWVIGVGGATSLPTANVSTQASTILGGGQANTIYSIINDKNEEILTFKSPASFTTLLLSHHKISVRSSFRIVNSKSIIDAQEFNGIFTSGKLHESSVLADFTQSAMVSRLGGSIGPGGGPRP